MKDNHTPKRPALADALRINLDSPPRYFCRKCRKQFHIPAYKQNGDIAWSACPYCGKSDIREI